MREQSVESSMTDMTTEASASTVLRDSGTTGAEYTTREGLPEDFNAVDYQQLLSKVSALQKEVDQLKATGTSGASDVVDSDRSPEPSNP